jgi:hypothetical protein
MPQDDLIPKPNTKSRYTEGEKEQALHILALCSGKSRRAARELEPFFKVDESTLRQWKKAEPERYQRIEDEVIPEKYRELASQNEAVGLKALKFQDDALDKLQAALEAGEIDIQKLSTDMRNAGVTGGIAQEKGALARGRPTEIKAVQDPVQLMRSLATRFPGLLEPKLVDAEVTMEDDTSDPTESP